MDAFDLTNVAVSKDGRRGGMVIFTNEKRVNLPI